MRRIFLVTLAILPLMTACGQTKSAQGAPVTSRVPPKPPLQRNQAPLIVIDAGHGGRDLGANHAQIQEKRAALTTALLVNKYLLEKGYRTLMTREKDEFIPLKKRASIANTAKGKLFVSIHYNAASNKAARGMEVYYYNSKEPWRLRASKKLAGSILQRMVATTGGKSRGVKAGNFCVIRETNMPAVLVEAGFITNKSEGALIQDNKYLDRIARSITDGIDRYFKG